MHSDTLHQRFEARYSNGQTAGAEEVTVELTQMGLVIHLAGGNRLTWPLAKLATAEPLTTHAIDALVTCSETPGATLFVPGPKFARTLAQIAPQLTASSARWQSARPWIWSTVALAALAVFIWLADLSPAHFVAELLPNKVRETMGRQVVASMTEQRRVCDAKSGRAALEQLTKRLSATVSPSRDFHVVVVDWGLVNAFATPGENIVLTRGLLEQATSSDEVAGVLAHEMGHGIELHPETGLVRAMGLSAAAELLMGGSSGTLGNLGVLLVQLSYTRDAEGQADDHALEILRNAKISSKGIANFFERMAKQHHGKSTGGLAGMLSTHPGTTERLAKILAMGGYASTPALPEAQWQSLKSMCEENS